MWLGQMVGVRRVDGVGGVEVGVESQRVVGVALQGSDAVVMRAPQGVADGGGEQRMRADLHEGRVVGAGRGDGLAEPHRIAQVGHPVVGIEDRRLRRCGRSWWWKGSGSSAWSAPNPKARCATRAISDQWWGDERPHRPRCAAPAGPGRPPPRSAHPPAPVVRRSPTDAARRTPPR